MGRGQKLPEPRNSNRTISTDSEIERRDPFGGGVATGRVIIGNQSRNDRACMLTAGGSCRRRQYSRDEGRNSTSIKRLPLNQRIDHEIEAENRRIYVESLRSDWTTDRDQLKKDVSLLLKKSPSCRLESECGKFSNERRMKIRESFPGGKLPKDKISEHRMSCQYADMLRNSKSARFDLPASPKFGRLLSNGRKQSDYLFFRETRLPKRDIHRHSYYEDDDSECIQTMKKAQRRRELKDLSSVGSEQPKLTPRKGLKTFTDSSVAHPLVHLVHPTELRHLPSTCVIDANIDDCEQPHHRKFYIKKREGGFCGAVNRCLCSVCDADGPCGCLNCCGCFDRKKTVLVRMGSFDKSDLLVRPHHAWNKSSGICGCMS